MIYCRACGLYMSNGFCLHGSVEQAKVALAEQRRQGKR